MKEKILKQFDESKFIFESFGEKCKGLIIELLKENAIIIHQITTRTKEFESINKKIDVKKDKYTNISEITDICGIRIISYLESDVDKIAKIINNEFEIDIENSIDKRNLKSDQFGYKSLHYVVSLNNERLVHTENRKYKGYKVEIQIRSILQHAWAEIEHDLGYKGAIAIPDNFKRNFNRLAALLETADIEFDRLKRDLSSYERDIKIIIENNPCEVKIDQASITSFLMTNKILEKARYIIKKNINCKFEGIGSLDVELERFDFFKIRNIGELEYLLNQNENHFLAFTDEFTKNISSTSLCYSIPLFYFLHFLAASKKNIDYIVDYFNYGEHRLGDHRFGNSYFIDVFNKTKQ